LVWPLLQALHGGFKINPQHQTLMFLLKLELHPVVLRKVRKVRKVLKVRQLAVLVAQRLAQVAHKGPQQ
jgi:hypothetical protein